MGGIPYLLTSLWILASACLALLTHLRLSSTSEPSYTPSHLTAPLAKKTWWSPTWIGLFFFLLHSFFLLVSSTASVLLVSKRTAFPSAHLRFFSVTVKLEL